VSVGDQIRAEERARRDRLDHLVRQGRLVVKALRDLRVTLATGVGATQVVAAVDLLAAEAALVDLLEAVAVETGADPAAVRAALVQELAATAAEQEAAKEDKLGVLAVTEAVLAAALEEALEEPVEPAAEQAAVREAEQAAPAGPAADKGEDKC
jgi:hypothetical protein